MLAAGATFFEGVGYIPDFLCHFDGSDGATAATDEGGHSLTFVGNAQLDTAQKKFGTASLLLDGTGDWVSVPNHADFLFEDGPFTVDLFFRRAAVNTSQLCGVFGTSTCWRILVSSDNLLFQYSVNGSDILTPISASPGTIGTGTWFHVAADRNESGLLRLYADGVMLGSDTVTADFFDGTNDFIMGASSTGANRFNGHIDEVRVIKGLALYDDDGGFTPPASPFLP